MARRGWVCGAFVVLVLLLSLAAPSHAETIGTLEWAECDDSGAQVFGDPVFEFNCSFDPGPGAGPFSYFRLSNFSDISGPPLTFKSLRLSLSVGSSLAFVGSDPFPVPGDEVILVAGGSLDLVGPAGLDWVALELDLVSPGFSYQLTRPRLVRPQPFATEVTGSVDLVRTEVVPEPSSLALLSVALFASARLRRGRSRRS